MTHLLPKVTLSELSTKAGQNHLPKPYKLRNYYLTSEIEVHNTSYDCWVSLFGKVYDLTRLIQENLDIEENAPLCKPIINAAGTDVSHWFDATTGEPKTYVDPKTNLRTVYCPWGRYLHIPPTEPVIWDSSFVTPWWNDNKFIIGNLSKKMRKLRIINMLTKDDDVIDVASEETANEILDRYSAINLHAASYTWKRIGRPLDMERTLEENGIIDESEEYERLGIDGEAYIPAVHLYFNDDLTMA